MPDADVTIFIVDDDPSVRKSLTRLIRTAGWNVEAFASGRDFLERLPFSGRGCLILDVTMPEITGLELRDQMATQNSTLPIIFLTGGNDPALSARAAKEFTRDFVDFLIKPVDAKTLLNAIETASQRTIRQHSRE
jgi:FixJ family two-component response regulator